MRAIARAEPGSHERVRARAAGVNFLLQLGPAFQHGLGGGLVIRLRQAQHGRGLGDVEVPRFFHCVAQKSGQRIMILLRNRVELVVVTRRATRRETEEGRAKRLHAVSRLVHINFFGDRAAFVGCEVAAHEAGRGKLVDILRRQQITRELLAHKGIEGLVGVKRADDVVAIRPDRAVVIEVDAVRVGVARVVEPVARAMLAIARTREQAVDHFRVGVG